MYFRLSPVWKCRFYQCTSGWETEVCPLNSFCLHQVNCAVWLIMRFSLHSVGHILQKDLFIKQNERKNNKQLMKKKKRRKKLTVWQELPNDNHWNSIFLNFDGRFIYWFFVCQTELVLPLSVWLSQVWDCSEFPLITQLCTCKQQAVFHFGLVPAFVGQVVHQYWDVCN